MDPDSAILDHPDRLPNIGNTCYINAVIQASTSSSLRPLLSEFPMVCPTSVDFEVRGDVLSELAKKFCFRNQVPLQRPFSKQYGIAWIC